MKRAPRTLRASRGLLPGVTPTLAQTPPPTMPMDMKPDAIAFCNWALARAHAAIVQATEAQEALRVAKLEAKLTVKLDSGLHCAKCGASSTCFNCK